MKSGSEIHLYGCKIQIDWKSQENQCRNNFRGHVDSLSICVIMLYKLRTVRARMCSMNQAHLQYVRECAV